MRFYLFLLTHAHLSALSHPAVPPLLSRHVSHETKSWQHQRTDRLRAFTTNGRPRDPRLPSPAPMRSTARRGVRGRKSLPPRHSRIGVGIWRQGRFGQLLLACPGCTRWRRNLYVKDGALACRRCNALDYRSRHEARRGAARAVNLASKLRQRLNANPVPFSGLPPRPRHHGSARVYDRLVAKLAALESQAVAEFAAVVKMAERRVHGRKRR